MRMKNGCTSKAGPCRIYCGQSDIATDFSPSTSAFFVDVIQPALDIH